MKAIYFEEHGGPEKLRFGDLDDPIPGPGEVLVAVEATSLNHLDLFVLRGMPGVKTVLPHVPGCDVSGRVQAVGEGVTKVSAGDRVLANPTLYCGECEFCLRGDASLCGSFGVIGEQTNGACCEKIVLPGRNLISIPDRLSFEEAAAVPLVFVTAWRMLITRGELEPGEDILILGAAAGVGTACIQIAKKTGARVFAAASSDEKLELCRQLGADVLINYSKEDIVDRVRKETGKRGVDVCVDYIGKDTWLKSLRSLARGGRLLTCGATTGYDPQTDLRHVFYRQLKVIGSSMGSNNELIAPLRLMAGGEIKPVIGKIFGLKETAEAFRLLQSREALGKIVIRVRGAR